MQELTDKVAVVTGGASGIGLALAHRFATEGMRVVIADVEKAALDKASEDLSAEHGAERVLAVSTDVRDPAAVDALAAATFERFGTAHVVCNNAGIGVGGMAWEIPADRWRWIIDVNLMGVANGIRAFVPRMIEQGEGHVVNTASAAGLVAGPGMAPYYATKHAVVATSESLYLDLQLTGADVGVSVLCPEWVRTGISDSERNAPADVAPVAPRGGPESSAMNDLVQGLVQGGLDPNDVAGVVLDAIRTNRFWILTHPTTLPTARKRWDSIAHDGKPVGWDVTKR